MRRMSGNSVVLGLFGFLLVAGIAIGFYVYNQADYRHESKADLGPLDKRLHIVIESAKKSKSFEIVHYEDVEDGMMVFTKNTGGNAPANLSANHITVNAEDKLEWSWGGDYSASAGTETADIYFQYIGKNENGPETAKPSPFPLLYGELFNPAITDIVVSNGDGLRQPAKIITTGKDKRIWVAYLPDSAEGTSFTIEGLDRSGSLIAAGELKDGTMGMSKPAP
ncbi:hypothetical protein [Paenibacillus spongiae]|uniref:Uncharacterized protein n=1 Tax=Paenibacillus spongiae TaxID=2909671 RepID=A0ABY5SFN8_9BACL|nr:hypothetical protein [Paenibacillus spongiae]UVI31320.1 hypothetical protein L1F29_05615 [Paenibacillus spongiae]